MPIFQSEILIHGNCQSLYNLTQDYSIRSKWDPFLKEARLIDGFSRVSIGARAWCVSKIGLGMETEYTFVKEPHVVAIKMTKGPSILKNFAGSWRFIELDNFKTKVVFRYYFSCGNKIIEHILKYLLTREMKKRLVVLKTKYERNKIN